MLQREQGRKHIENCKGSTGRHIIVEVRSLHRLEGEVDSKDLKELPDSGSSQCKGKRVP